VRGTIVHDLACQYDLGAIADPAAVECIHKGYFLAYVHAMRTIKPKWTLIEQALVSPDYRWGGRPDRAGRVYGAWAVLDIKTGVRSKATPIQLALQAMLAGPELHLPPEAILRYELDVKANGKMKLFEHPDRRDFDKAAEVIQECCR
jgi:hypothetical protein